MTKITKKQLAGILQSGSGIGSSTLGAGQVTWPPTDVWPPTPPDWERDKEDEAERIKRFMDMIGGHDDRKEGKLKQEVEDWKEKCRVLELENKGLKELNGHLERALEMLGNTTTKENTNV